MNTVDYKRKSLPLHFKYHSVLVNVDSRIGGLVNDNLVNVDMVLLLLFKVLWALVAVVELFATKHVSCLIRLEQFNLIGSVLKYWVSTGTRCSPVN